MVHRTTSAHVARAAGVSRATVSYVLNNRTDKQISESTRRSVLDAATKLNYSPSPAARALRSGRGDVVVALVPHGWDDGGPIGSLLSDIGSELGMHDLAFLRFQADIRPGVVRRLLKAVAAECVVTFEPLDSADQAALEHAGVPEVRAWILESGAGEDSIRIGQSDIVRTQVEHLISTGCDRLVYAAEAAQRANEFVRVRAYEFSTLRGEIGYRTMSTRYLGAATSSATAAVRSWITDGERVGVCAFSDIVAGRVLAAARDLDVDVPGELSVVGVDDSPLSAFLVPPLTTVGFDLAREATLIAGTILSRLKRGSSVPDGQDRPSVWLIPRASTPRPADKARA